MWITSKEVLLTISVTAIASFLLLPSAKAQQPGLSFKVVYNFTGGNDGCCIYSGLGRDSSGNLYGVAYSGDNETGNGDLFKLINKNGFYLFAILHSFSGSDGRNCQGTPAVDKSGNVFGVCSAGGGPQDGVLWAYSHAGKFTVLHTFGGPGDGMMPQDNLALDGAGNIYGTTYTYGAKGSGTLWRYSLSSRTFKVLHAFADGDDGALLPTGPAIDKNGVLWGTTEFGPNCYYCGDGTAWSYDPSSSTFTTIVDFSSGGIEEPTSRLALDQEGNLYGTASEQGVENDCGVVYELPKENAYQPEVLYHFIQGTDPCYLYGWLTFDKHGNLLGTSYNGGSSDDGAVYGLVPGNGTWREITLHSFNYSDGWRPQAGLVTDNQGNWFSTTSLGGKLTWGTVFVITGVP